MHAPRWVYAFDTVVGDFVHAWRTPVLTSVFYVLTVLANTGTIVFITTVAVLAFAVRRKYAEAALVLVVVAGGQALGALTKLAIVRQRPPASGALIPLPGSYAFPSGHALAAILLYGVLAFLLLRSLRDSGARIAVSIAAVALIALIGLSRVYLGVHWPSDVVAAWVLGGAWLAACASVYLRWDRRRASVADQTTN